MVEVAIGVHVLAVCRLTVDDFHVALSATDFVPGVILLHRLVVDAVRVMIEAIIQSLLVP